MTFSAFITFDICRERPPWRCVKGGATPNRSLRNATEGVPYRSCCIHDYNQHSTATE